MNYSPARTLILFFLGLIVVGVLLLSLPAARSSAGFSFITSLFTSVSAVCVTGLSVVNIDEYYSTFGQVVILILVQLGGVGYMFVSIFFALLFGKIALKDRRIMQDIFDISSFSGLKELLLKAVFFVLVIEFTGAVVLTFIFSHSFSFLRSIYLGIFYSVAAFCNAGFGFFCDSLAGFANDPALLYVISALVLIGGLGFFVIVDIYDTYRKKHLHLWTHTKVVLFISTAITFFAFVLFLFSDTLRGHGIFYSINNAFFQAVSARTAGFYSVPVNLFSEFIDVMLLFLMSAGASPGSTAGGVKVTTLALTFVFVKSVLKGDDDFVLFKRCIPVDLVKKALVVFIIFFASIAFFSVVLILFESCLTPLAVIFEVVSAFAAVGLSLGITADLSTEGKVLIIIAMIAGRIGMLTLSILVLNPAAKKKSIKYPGARILVG